MTNPAAPDLAGILNPRSVAIIGASDDPRRIGGRPLAYMHNHGFEGTIYPVNPTRDTVQGLKSYPSIAEIDGAIDTAIIAIPARHVKQAILDLAAKGTKGCIVFSSGFAEMGEEGAEAQREIADIARREDIRILGPNCLGVLNVHDGFYATFSGSIEWGEPFKGGLSIVTQSGAFGGHLYYMSRQARLGTRYLVTTGNECDVQVAEAIRMAAEDEKTRVILAYSEGIRDGEMLIGALETAAEAEKPVVFMKVGRSEVGAKAASSHTASLTGEDAVIDAVLRQYGVHRARTTEELIDVAAATLARNRPQGRRLGLITISGGVGVMMADAAEDYGLDVAPMSEEAQKSVTDLLPFAAPANPVDVTAQVLNQLDLIPKFFGTLLDKGGYDAIAAFFTTASITPATAGPFLESLKRLKAEYPDAYLVLSLFVDGELGDDYRALGYPVFEDPSRAIAAIAAAAKFVESFRRLAGRTVPALPASRGLPAGAIGEADAKRILAEAGIPVLDETLARTAGEAVAAAGERPVAMKIVSPEVQHKTEIGGVLLDVAGAEAVAAGFETLSQRLAQHAPDATLDGILVSPMVEGGIETILGVSRDPVFGPVVMLGMGGILVEVLRDVSFRKAPFDVAEAHRMIDELRGRALFDGARGAPPADIEALAETLSRLSVFAAAEADSLESVDINPFVVFKTGKGGVALDALIVPRGEG